MLCSPFKEDGRRAKRSLSVVTTKKALTSFVNKQTGKVTVVIKETDQFGQSVTYPVCFSADQLWTVAMNRVIAALPLP